MKQSQHQNTTKAETVPVWPTAAQRLGIGKNSAYATAKKGELPTIRLGKRLLVPVAALNRMLAVGVEKA